MKKDMNEIISVASQEWRSFIEPMASLGEKVVPLLQTPEDPLLRHEQYRQMFSILSLGYWFLLYQDADNPDFVPAYLNIGARNPDDVITSTPINAEGTYKIKGTRGHAHIVTFSIGSGDFYTRAIGEQVAPNLEEYDLDTIDINENGSYEIILSSKRPEGHEGNWWYLDPKCTYLLLRQRLYDWNAEMGRVAIQRLDQPIMRPRKTTEQLSENMQLFAQWVEAWTRWGVEWTDRSRRLGYINKVEVNGVSELGGYKIQKYIMGLWDLEPDEALIYETEIPEEVRYWMIHLVDDIYAVLDNMNINRQSSINGFSAHLDSDGKFRAVLCAEDPGVPNWLDTAGYKTGAMFGRWLQASSYPEPVCTKVKLADLRKHIPADTPVVTAEERDKVLRERRENYQMMHRWN